MRKLANTLNLRRYLQIGLLVCLGWCAQGDATSSKSSSNDLWLTGPLVTASARVIPKGHINVEPYLFSTVTTGNYNDDWKSKDTPKFIAVNPQLLIKTGLLDTLDYTILIQSYSNSTQGVQSTQFGDIPFALGYQLYKGENSTYVRTSFGINIPTGKYQKMKAAKLGTDAGGAGSFYPTLSFGASRVYNIVGEQYCRPRFSIDYSIGTPVYVKGVNTYGGDPSTRGKVLPGNIFNFDFGIEYTLTKRWALACDFTAQCIQKTRFKGSTTVSSSRPSGTQFTLAPAIEYNWNDSMGIIVGSWFTVAGRNSTKFYSAAAAYNYYF